MLVGLPGSGKDEVARIISEEFGYEVIVMSDLVREEAERLGMEPTREGLRRLGGLLRERDGPSAVAKLVLRKIACMERESPRPGYVVNGIRNIEEVDEIRRAFGGESLLLAVLSPRELRFHRLVRRGRAGFDPESWEALVREDRREVTLFHMGDAMALADRFVVNDCGLEELRIRVLKVILGF